MPQSRTLLLRNAMRVAAMDDDRSYGILTTVDRDRLRERHNARACMLARGD
jgi:hypothetical protein